MLLDGSSPLQVLLDFCRVLVVEASRLLIELLVAFVDIVHVCFLVFATVTTELCPLGNPA